MSFNLLCFTFFRLPIHRFCCRRRCIRRRYNLRLSCFGWRLC
jgi:hypothetical protein